MPVILQYGKDYEYEAPVKLLDKLLHDLPQSPDEQIVVVSQVLPHSCTFIPYEIAFALFFCTLIRHFVKSRFLWLTSTLDTRILLTHRYYAQIMLVYLFMSSFQYFLICAKCSFQIMFFCVGSCFQWSACEKLEKFGQHGGELQ